MRKVLQMTLVGFGVTAIIVVVVRIASHRMYPTVVVALPAKFSGLVHILQPSLDRSSRGSQRIVVAVAPSGFGRSEIRYSNEWHGTTFKSGATTIPLWLDRVLPSDNRRYVYEVGNRADDNCGAGTEHFFVGTPSQYKDYLTKHK